MADPSSFNYSQQFHYGRETLQEYPLRTVSLTMDPYEQRALPNNTNIMGTALPPQVKDFQGYTYTRNAFGYLAPPPMTQAPYEEQGTFTSGLLPISTNPPNSLSSWAFHPPPAQTSDYLTHSPAWPVDVTNYDYCPCEQQIPMQMPELGYESSSPASEGIPYGRMAVSESPVPKVEANDDCSPMHRVIHLDEDSENVDPCYAELLRQCLLEAPDHTMSLRDLYAWVSEHSPKAKDPNSTGWKNSVRHNLSMNQGFEKVVDKTNPSSSGSKHRSFWRLTEDAAIRGIQSTTRYRKGDGKRKAQRSNHHVTRDDKRVKSGAKGGQATRRLANRRAAAAARSDWVNTRHQNNHRDEPYPTRSRAAPEASSPSSNISHPISAIPSYWPNMADVRDHNPYGTATACKVEHNVQDFAEIQDFHHGADLEYYHDPHQWSQTASPVVGLVKHENGWLGDPQAVGLGLIS